MEFNLFTMCGKILYNYFMTTYNNNVRRKNQFCTIILFEMKLFLLFTSFFSSLHATLNLCNFFLNTSLLTKEPHNIFW